jgi:hypothetical protein
VVRARRRYLITPCSHHFEQATQKLTPIHIRSAPPPQVMDNTETVPASDANRDELVERLKRENAALMEQKAASDARAGQFESKERARVTAWQSDVKSFLTDFVLAEAPDAEAKADCQPVVQWGDEYASKADIVSQTGLARVCARATTTRPCSTSAKRSWSS